MPGKAANNPEMVKPATDNVMRVTFVSRPSLAVYPAPPSGKAPAPAAMICPGGGYGVLAYDIEGTEIAAWLNSIGMTAVVLKYRVPDAGAHDDAYEDAQRAMCVIREYAAEWNIDPKRIGVIGFSAGGHLGARLSTGFNEPSYPKIDAADDLSRRPDFAILVYPAYLVDKTGQLAPELKISAGIPPTLIIHTEDDKLYEPGSVAYHAALDTAKVPNKFQLYPKGGHGYGLRRGADAHVWPQVAREWLTQIGVLHP